MATNRKRFFLPILLLVLLHIPATLPAGPVSENKALQVASHFVSTLAPLRSDAGLQLIYQGFGKEANALRNGQTPLLYIYNIGESDGFVIVSGDDNAYPVLGYADKGSIRTERMPPNLRNWLDFYEEEIGRVSQSGASASAEITQQWENLLTEAKMNISPGYLLSTANWDQMAPYNGLCPMDSTERSVTGCVATAMGILMKYHEWPERGKGKVAYTSNDKHLISETFSTTYNWSNMLHTYNYKNGKPAWSDMEEKAVATLLYHCGAASYMQYSQEASAAYTHNAIIALIDNFRYDQEMYLACRDLYTTGEWHALMRTELNEGRPVMYGGSSEESGHQFIVDGYTDNRYYHINWGWNGLANGYYLLSSLEPTWQGIGGSVDGAGFSMNQDAAIGLQPEISGSTPNHEMYFYETGKRDYYGIYTKTQDKIIRDKPFDLCFTELCDYGMRDFEPLFAVFLEDRNYVVKDTLLIFQYNGVLEGYYVMWEEQGIPMKTTLPVEEGDKIRMFYSSNEGKSWKPVRGTSNATMELEVHKEELVANQHTVLPGDIEWSQTADDLFIRAAETIDINRIILYDSSGRIVKEQSVLQGERQVTLLLSTLKTGIYIVSVETKNGNYTHKIVRK